jgi:D-alanyl-D-alanine carboxypeptidase
MKNILISGLIILCSLTATAQKLSPAKQVDNYIAQQIREQKLTGLSLAVVKDGKVVKATGYGMADIENKVPATAQTVYKIASVSKQFLAAAILLLQQDGKLKITDKLSLYIPEVPASWSAITVQRLLNHSAGLPLDIPAFDPYKMQTDSALTHSLFTAPLLYPPGDKLSYSNAGYFVVAEVIKRVSGMPWQDFIAKRIFKPLQMNSARATSTTDLIINRAHGYKVKSGVISNAEDWIALRPSGAFVTTVSDLAKWDAALYGNAILTSESKQQLWAPVRFNNVLCPGLEPLSF